MSDDTDDLLFYRSAYEQADATLRLILDAYADHQNHERCGLICKINAIEGLIEAYVKEQQ